jgi:D-tyrosyl-tRNA(Tyr) deacylase
MNKSVIDIGGKLLLVPQFTLYAHTKKNRPSFHRALAPDRATELFDYFTEKCRELVDVETGEFGAFMNVSLLNSGPVTILLEKEFD